MCYPKNDTSRVNTRNSKLISQYFITSGSVILILIYGEEGGRGMVLLCSREGCVQRDNNCCVWNEISSASWPHIPDVRSGSWVSGKKQKIFTVIAQ